MADECSWDFDTLRKTMDSLWLHQTLTDFSRKAKAIRMLLGEDDDCSGIDLCKKAQILEVLDDLKQSYCTLAEKHDQLMTRTKRKTGASEIYEDGPRAVLDSSDPESTVEDPEVEFPDQIERKPATEIFPGDDIRIKLPGRSFLVPDWEKNEDRMRVEVLKLIEESLLNQDKLVKRNEEKRGTINQLRFEIECLKSEVKALQDCIVTCPRVKPQTISSQFKMVRLGGLVLRKIFKRKFP